jgi:hypothetical protein
MFILLQLVVGPNSLPELPKGLKNSSSKSHMMTTMDNIVTGVRDASYPTGMTERGKYLHTKSAHNPKLQLLFHGW